MDLKFIPICIQHREMPGIPTYLHILKSPFSSTKYLANRSRYGVKVEKKWYNGFVRVLYLRFHHFSKNKWKPFLILEGKGRILTQSYYKSPYTDRQFQKATWQHKNATKNFDYKTIANRHRTVSWSNNSHRTCVETVTPTTATIGHCLLYTNLNWRWKSTTNWVTFSTQSFHCIILYRLINVFSAEDWFIKLLTLSRRKHMYIIECTWWKSFKGWMYALSPSNCILYLISHYPHLLSNDYINVFQWVTQRFMEKLIFQI